MLVVEEACLPAGEEIITIVMTTVLLSVFAHGVTAYPGAVWYARRVEAAGPDECKAEIVEVTEMPVRIRH